MPERNPVLSSKGIWTAVALDRSALVSFSNLNWGRLPYGVGTPLLCAETLMTAFGADGLSTSWSFLVRSQRSKTPRQTQDKDHDGGPILALSGLSRARHDGLYRTLGTLTTSSMAGRDCLPATHSDSATHARRAHAYRELQNTSSMHLRHASGSTLKHPISSSRHANKVCICSAHAP